VASKSALFDCYTATSSISNAPTAHVCYDTAPSYVPNSIAPHSISNGFDSRASPSASTCYTGRSGGRGNSTHLKSFL